MASSIDGLGSGLDTTTIVSQLMSIERQPQDRLVSQRLSVLSAGTAWGQIGVGLAAVKTAADRISTSGALGAATATSTAVGTATVAVTPGAAPGTHTLSVQTLATAGSYARGVASAATVVGAGSLVAARGTAALGISAVSAPAGASPPAANGTYAVEVRSVTGTSAELVVNGVSSTVDTSGGSFSAGGLQFSSSGLTVGTAAVTVARTDSPTATVADLAAQFNAAGGVASASVVTTTDASGTSTTRLLLSSTATGTAGAVTTSTDGLAGLGAQTQVRGAQDARFTLDGLSDIVRSSNSVDDLLPGVTLGLVAAGGPETTVTVGKDTAAGATAVKDLVSALNSVLSTISTNTRYDVAKKAGSPLTGDSGARALVAQLQNAVSSAGIGASSTLGALGITLQRDGTYAFDQAAFSSALAKDPAGSAALVGALSSGLSTLATTATAYDGVTKAGVASATAQAARMQTQVDTMTTQLGLTETRLRKTFTDLDTALGSLKSQGTWLTSQLAGL